MKTVITLDNNLVVLAHTMGNCAYCESYELRTLPYNKEIDAFIDGKNTYSGIDVRLIANTEVQHLYEIYKVWTEEHQTPIAKEIEAFLWEYDTVDEWEYLNTDMCIYEEIENQLVDIYILKEVVQVLRNDELTPDEQFHKLKELLTI